MKESNLQREIRKQLKKRFGGKWFKTHGNMYTEPGMPDIIGCCQGLFFAIEVKTPLKGKLSIHQINFLKEVKNSNSFAVVTSSLKSVIQKVKKHLIKNGKIPKSKTRRIPKGSKKLLLRKKEYRVIYANRKR